MTLIVLSSNSKYAVLARHLHIFSDNAKKAFFNSFQSNKRYSRLFVVSLNNVG